MIVKSSATSVIGLIFGMKRCVVPLLVLHPDEDEPGEEPRDEGDAQIDEDALCDLADGDVDRHSPQAEQGGKEVMKTQA